MRIIAYEHIGIRVSDRLQALEFYEKLGFIFIEVFPRGASQRVSYRWWCLY
ncbi:MAG: hypothetical protein WBA39_08395 [Rivularia sp. (in: cyanobacteria)]